MHTYSTYNQNNTVNYEVVKLVLALILDILFCSESKDADASSQQAQAGTGLVVGIVLAVFIVFLIIVDVSCYFLNSCGLTMFLCGKLCKKESPYAKEKTMEEGERCVNYSFLHLPIQNLVILFKWN